MAQGMTRRGLPATLAAAGAAVLAACSGRRDDRLATEEHEVVAPSGAFTAIVVADGEELRPTIRDTSGEPVWTDDLPHVERYFLGVLGVGEVRSLGAVACRLHGCPPFHPLVWAKVEECL